MTEEKDDTETQPRSSPKKPTTTTIKEPEPGETMASEGNPSPQQRPKPIKLEDEVVKLEKIIEARNEELKKLREQVEKMEKDHKEELEKLQKEYEVLGGKYRDIIKKYRDLVKRNKLKLTDLKLDDFDFGGKDGEPFDFKGYIKLTREIRVMEQDVIGQIYRKKQEYYNEARKVIAEMKAITNELESAVMKTYGDNEIIKDKVIYKTGVIQDRSTLTDKELIEKLKKLYLSNKMLNRAPANELATRFGV